MSSGQATKAVSNVVYGDRNLVAPAIISAIELEKCMSNAHSGRMDVTKPKSRA